VAAGLWAALLLHDPPRGWALMGCRFHAVEPGRGRCLCPQSSLSRSVAFVFGRVGSVAVDSVFVFKQMTRIKETR